MTFPQATRRDHDTFCRTERWDRVRDARGRTGTHRVTDELTAPDGRILRTRISHPVDRSGYGPGLRAHILRDQLDVGPERFWACVRDGRLPDRGTPAPASEALPADLVHLLVTRVGLPDSEVARMTKDEAITRLQEYWTEGR